MKQAIYMCLALVLTGWMWQSCDDGETYAEQRERERDAIAAFLGRDVVIRSSDGEELIRVGKINTISEGTFYAQDSTTNLERNEYVVFENTGVYMQIVRKGAGDKLRSGQQKRIICRYTEFNILRDSVQTTNNSSYWATNPDIMDVTNNLRHVHGFVQHIGQWRRSHVCLLWFNGRACRLAGTAHLYQHRPPVVGRG